MFSISTLDGLKQIGFRFSRRESQAFIRLWRYSGHLVGVPPELLCASEEEARHLAELVLATQGDPDHDSKRLIQSLMDDGIHETYIGRKGLGRIFTSNVTRKLFYGFSTELVGAKLTGSLGYPRSRWAELAVPASRGLISMMELGRMLLPGGTRAATALGARTIERLVNLSAQAVTA